MREIYQEEESKSYCAKEMRVCFRYTHCFWVERNREKERRTIRKICKRKIESEREKGT